MPTYNVPKKRRTVRTIKINNGVLTGETDDRGNVYWFRNGKYITPSVQKRYRYYDSKLKGYRTLGNHVSYSNNSKSFIPDNIETPVYTPVFNKVLEKANKERVSKERLRNSQNIPSIGQKIITLRTNGRMNLVDVPVNMLDSIAVNAGRANTDFWKAMGLVGKESTFGGVSRALKQVPYEDYEYTAPQLVNNHAYFKTPYDDYIGALYRKYNDMTDEGKLSMEKDIKYAVDNNLIKDKTPHYSKYILADAFERYNVNPAKYNPGQSNYVPMINNIEKELKAEKQLQQYWNERGKREYNRGYNERRRLESRGTKSK